MVLTAGFPLSVGGYSRELLDRKSKSLLLPGAGGRGH